MIGYSENTNTKDCLHNIFYKKIQILLDHANGGSDVTYYRLKSNNILIGKVPKIRRGRSYLAFSRLDMSLYYGNYVKQAQILLPVYANIVTCIVGRLTSIHG
jgi:hypothetical protein